MSTDIISPNTEITEKDKRRLAFQRGDRIQDHGVAANTYERDDEFDREMAQRRKDKLAHRVLDDQLASMSPSQLEDEANKLLADTDLEEEMANEDNEAIPTFAEIEADEDAEFKQQRFSPSGRNFSVVDVRDEGNYTDEDSLAQEMSVRRQMRGRRGSTSSPDFTYEGSHGDDEDLADTAAPMGGYQIR